MVHVATYKREEIIMLYGVVNCMLIVIDSRV